jgi:isoleucyl-tRNA synthetase
MQQVILLGRKRREDARINLRTPLRLLTIVHRDGNLLEDIEGLESYVRQELNVKQVRYDQDEAAYTTLYAKPNFPVLGRRLGKRMKAFQPLIEALERDEIENLQRVGTVTLDGETFDTNEIQVFREAREGTAAVSNRFISIDLDCTLDDVLVAEGYAREAVNRIQRARKDMGLHVADRIELVRPLLRHWRHTRNTLRVKCWRVR